MNKYELFTSLYVLHMCYRMYKSLDESEEEEQEVVEQEKPQETQSEVEIPDEQIIQVKKRKKKPPPSDDKKRVRRVWVKECYLDRNVSGYFITFKEIKEKDPDEFFRHTRMTRKQYDDLLELVKKDLTKRSVRQPIPVDCRLAITLSYLSEGFSQQDLSDMFKAGKSSIREIILETCTAIWRCLSSRYLQQPNKNEYKKIAEDFYYKLNIPNCLGAMDEKSVPLICPPRRGFGKNLTVKFYVSCDSDYCFTSVEVVILPTVPQNEETTETSIEIISDELPDPENLPASEIIFPYYFVGSKSIPLKDNLMCPYDSDFLDQQKTTFNRNLSYVTRITDNAFGVLFARWKVLQTTLHCLPENAKMVYLAAFSLHNYIMQKSQVNGPYCPEGYIDWHDEEGNLHLGNWRNEFKINSNSKTADSSMASEVALQMRDTLAKYLYDQLNKPVQIDIKFE